MLLAHKGSRANGRGERGLYVFVRIAANEGIASSASAYVRYRGKHHITGFKRTRHVAHNTQARIMKDI
eukprot:scaffold257548_cov28-Tisochrysis_lutea.AAC.1